MSSHELFKTAILGIPSRSSSSVNLSTMAEEVAQEINLNPNRDPVDIICAKVQGGALNRNQTDRLVEMTNAKSMRSVLDSKNKAASTVVVKKPDVHARLKGTAPDSPGLEFPGKDKASDFRFNQNEAAKGPEMPKTASARDALFSSDMIDYHSGPQSLPAEPMEPYEPEPLVPSATRLKKTASYIDATREHFDGEDELFSWVYEGAASGFAKVASQYVLQGTSFEDVVSTSLKRRPYKSTVELLKMAAVKCRDRGLMHEEVCSDWVTALDAISGTNLEKSAAVGIPVSESLISKDIRGRVRILNGDSHLIKHLDTVGKIEDRIRKARLIKDQLPDTPANRIYSSRVTNVSD